MNDIKIKTVPKIEEIREDILSIDDWEERYKYIIDLGRKLPAFPNNLQRSKYKMHDCTSQVWLFIQLEEDGNTLEIIGDSDAMIVKGLMALAIAMYEHSPLEQVLATNAQTFFHEIQLDEYLTARRTSALLSIVKMIQNEARRILNLRSSQLVEQV